MKLPASAKHPETMKRRYWGKMKLRAGEKHPEEKPVSKMEKRRKNTNHPSLSTRVIPQCIMMDRRRKPKMTYCSKSMMVRFWRHSMISCELVSLRMMNTTIWGLVSAVHAMSGAYRATGSH